MDFLVGDVNGKFVIIKFIVNYGESVIKFEN